MMCPMRALCFFVAAIVTMASTSWAESAFWEEMITPGITEYGEHVEAAGDHIRQGEYEAALGRLELARARLPQHAPAHAWSGFALSKLGRFEEAVVRLERAVTLDADVIDDETLGFAWSVALAKAGRFEAAYEASARILARGPSPGLRPIALINAADMLVASSCGRLDEAIDLYEEAARDYPSRADAHWGLGAALFRAGRDEESRREIATAVRLDPQWLSILGDEVFFTPPEEAHLYRALGWEVLANITQSRQEWTTYLESLGPDACWGEAARGRLQALRGRPSRQGR